MRDAKGMIRAARRVGFVPSGRDVRVKQRKQVDAPYPIGLTGAQRHRRMLAEHDRRLTEEVKAAGLYKPGDKTRTRKQWTMALRRYLDGLILDDVYPSSS